GPPYRLRRDPAALDDSLRGATRGSRAAGRTRADSRLAPLSAGGAQRLRGRQQLGVSAAVQPAADRGAERHAHRGPPRARSPQGPAHTGAGVGAAPPPRAGYLDRGWPSRSTSDARDGTTATGEALSIPRGFRRDAGWSATPSSSTPSR